MLDPSYDDNSYDDRPEIQPWSIAIRKGVKTALIGFALLGVFLLYIASARSRQYYSDIHLKSPPSITSAETFAWILCGTMSAGMGLLTALATRPAPKWIQMIFGVIVLAIFIAFVVTLTSGIPPETVASP
mgnify:CR=1 FL=1